MPLREDHFPLYLILFPPLYTLYYIHYTNLTMANLIKIDTQEYPVTVEEFKLRFPDTSFPVQIPFADFGYAVVFPTPQPAHDATTQTVREIAPALTHKGTWEQRWKVESDKNTG